MNHLTFPLLALTFMIGGCYTGQRSEALPFVERDALADKAKESKVAFDACLDDFNDCSSAVASPADIADCADELLACLPGGGGLPPIPGGSTGTTGGDESTGTTGDGTAGGTTGGGAAPPAGDCFDELDECFAGPDPFACFDDMNDCIDQTLEDVCDEQYQACLDLGLPPGSCDPVKNAC